MPKTWALYEAKNKLTEVIDKALTSGPQTITRHGVATVVVVSTADFRKLTQPRDSLREFFARSPLRGLRLELSRRQDTERGTRLELPV